MHHYGQVFRELRKSKKYSLKQISGPEVSIAQLSRFERGESELSLSKFFYSLDKLQITVEDFSAKLRQYKDSHAFQFLARIDALEDLHDLDELKKIHRIEGDKLDKSPDNVFLKLNYIIISALMSKIREWYQPSKEDLTLVSTYLFDTDEWGEYEFTLINTLCPYFKSSLVKKIGEYILKHEEQLAYDSKQKHSIIMTLLTIYQYYLEKKDFNQAANFKKSLEKTIDADHLVYERMVFHYLKGYSDYLQGKKSGKKQMKHVLEMWKHIDADTIYDKYRAHYKQETDD